VGYPSQASHQQSERGLAVPDLQEILQKQQHFKIQQEDMQKGMDHLTCVGMQKGFFSRLFLYSNRLIYNLWLF
jgi:hypothetical protein